MNAEQNRKAGEAAQQGFIDGLEEFFEEINKSGKKLIFKAGEKANEPIRILDKP